ncbi:MAG: hypothetical protein ACK56I_09885, partial [bacterium]
MLVEDRARIDVEDPRALRVMQDQQAEEGDLGGQPAGVNGCAGAQPGDDPVVQVPRTDHEPGDAIRKHQA